MNEELIYRRDCDLFAESMDYEGVIHDLMAEYDLTWHTNPENPSAYGCGSGDEAYAEPSPRSDEYAHG